MFRIDSDFFMAVYPFSTYVVMSWGRGYPSAYGSCSAHKRRKNFLRFVKVGSCHDENIFLPISLTVGDRTVKYRQDLLMISYDYRFLVTSLQSKVDNTIGIRGSETPLLDCKSQHSKPRGSGVTKRAS